MIDYVLSGFIAGFILGIVLGIYVVVRKDKLVMFFCHNYFYNTKNMDIYRRWNHG